MVHETWLPQSTDKATEGCQDWGCSKRDSASFELLEQTRNGLEIPYKNRLRTQLAGINQQVGTNLTTLVPVWSAVITLRESKFIAVACTTSSLLTHFFQQWLSKEKCQAFQSNPACSEITLVMPRNHCPTWSAIVSIFSQISRE
jgi:hypothetical protein